MGPDENGYLLHYHGVCRKAFHFQILAPESPWSSNWTRYVGALRTDVGSNPARGSLNAVGSLIGKARQRPLT